MALNDKTFEIFKNELLKAAKDLSCDELIFRSEWIYDLPTQNLKIGKVSLPDNYQIPTGWDGYGEDDLIKMETMGLLEKISETEEDPVTFEKEIVYRVVKPLL